jgi:hypothetical protein
LRGHGLSGFSNFLKGVQWTTRFDLCTNKK